ncbi:hypothetical protein HYT59_00700 [Candidatus Woesebacteria bacterium]|nr:hypothetical protein [Candidatus Woesebacteria bacterium]
MKLALLTIATILIGYGLLGNQYSILTIGAVLFLLTLTLDLLLIYRFAKEYKANSNEAKIQGKKQGQWDLPAKWLEGIIVVTGLVLMIIGGDNDELLVPGIIIWGGEIIIYFIGG